MNFYETIYVERETVERYEALLLDENVSEKDMLGKDNVLDTFDCEFSDGTLAQIQVCAGNHNYYVNPVLFALEGPEKNILEEISCLDVEDSLAGEYEFEVGNNLYIVQILPFASVIRA